MERAAALVLAGKIETTWFGRLANAQLDAWIDALCQLDEGAAGTAYARLCGRVEKLTIAQFLIEAKSVRTHDGSKPRGEPCPHCSDSGWVEAPDFTVEDATYNDKPVTYSAVQPCSCREGSARAGSAVWLESNPRRERAA